MRVLSGIQPSGTLHLGNYFGAMKQHIELQQFSECFFFLADFHALTTMQDGTRLRKLAFDAAIDYLALGLDPKKATFFRQSDVPHVCELAWIFSTVTNMSLLERGTSYRDKIENGKPASVGLFYYPLLMAADILIYHANIVPVGRDQKQHIEFARDIAGFFNDTFGEYFTLPEPQFNATPVVQGTDGRKMSKSYGNTIELFADETVIEKQIKAIKTNNIAPDMPKDPAKCNVFGLLKLLASAEEAMNWEQNYLSGGVKYSDVKTRLFELHKTIFGDKREIREYWSAHPQEVEAILLDGAHRARTVAGGTIEKVRAMSGLLNSEAYGS